MKCGMTMFRLPEKVIWPYYKEDKDGKTNHPADFNGEPTHKGSKYKNVKPEI